MAGEPRKPAKKTAASKQAAPKKASASTRTKMERALKSAERSMKEAEDVVRERPGSKEAREATAAAKKAGAAAVALAEDVAPDDPLLDTAIRQIEAGATDTKPFGEPGQATDQRTPLRIAFQASIGVLAAVLLAKCILLARSILIITVVSAFLAVGLNPAVEWLQRRGLRRGRAVGAIFLVVILFFAGFAFAAIPPVVDQASQLTKKIPTYAEQLQRENSAYRRLDEQFEITEKLKERFQEGALIETGSKQVFSVARGLLSAMFNLLTGLVLTLYFLSSYPNIKRSAYRLIPRSRRPRVGLLADEILARVGGYVLGNIATSIVAGVLAGIFLVIVGVPSPIALALLVALLDLIPLVGASLAAFVCVIVAFFVSVPVGIATLIYFVLYQQFENYLLVPRIMQRTVSVSPLATILAALIGASLLGVVGALLAIPVAAAIQLIGTEVVYPRQDAI